MSSEGKRPWGWRINALVCFLTLTAAITPMLASGADAGTSIAHQDFINLCAECHNADAKGNGPLAKNLSKVPPDLTRIKQRAHGKFDEKAVYDWILGLKMAQSHGSREMPIWGDWLMDEAIEEDTSLSAAKAAEKEVEQRVMGIVKYLEALQAEN